LQTLKEGALRGNIGFCEQTAVHLAFMRNFQIARHNFFAPNRSARGDDLLNQQV
jgi:hypothetical protein